MKVSVLIPLYNAENYIRQAVESALAQQETAEVIIWDDCSTDRSRTIALGLGERSPKIRVYWNTQNLGNYAVRNRLIQGSKCDYVTFLDADDYFLPNRFHVAAKILESDSTVDGVYEAIENFYDDPEQQREWLLATTAVDRLVALPYVSEANSLFEAIMTNDNGATNLQQFVLRRKVFDLIPSFNENIRRGADMAAVFQMAALCRLVPGKLDQPILMRRLHDKNVTRTENRKYVLESVKYFVGWSHLHLNPSAQQHVDRFLKRYAKTMFPFRTLSRWRPYRLFHPIRIALQISALIYHFPHLLRSRSFWAAIKCEYFTRIARRSLRVTNEKQSRILQ